MILELLAVGYLVSRVFNGDPDPADTTSDDSSSPVEDLGFYSDRSDSGGEYQTTLDQWGA